ncbi:MULTISPECIES: hypothetical protein [unclassified Bradyrhizobium]|uniref:hypothetical protein n=1 Tax=unclassified Bradyrhizobium TaxID=2631580 RepID=UPI002916BB56|nr:MULTISPECIES: hypothetical protein [unclassified Bradyrhizobium]
MTSIKSLQDADRFRAGAAAPEPARGGRKSGPMLDFERHLFAAPWPMSQRRRNAWRFGVDASSDADETAIAASK